MDTWSHPPTIGDWLKGVVALRPIVLVLLLSLGLIAELFVATREDPSRYQVRDED